MGYSISQHRAWLNFIKAGILAERRYELREGQERHVLDFATFCREGSVGVSCAGESTLPSWLPGAGSRVDILRFSPEEIQGRLPECLKPVQEAIGARGGLA